MRLFYFISRNISYTSAIGLYTIAIGWVVGAFGALLGSAFIIIDYSRILFFTTKWVIPSVIFTSLGHMVVMGFLTPFKIPALFKIHRKINASFKSQNYDEFSDEEMIELYGKYSDLPMHNMVLSFFAIFIIFCIILGFTFFELNSGVINELEIKAAHKMLALSVIFIMLLYGMSTYLLTEALTNNERNDFYNQVLKRGINIKPRALIGVRVKFSFFVILMIISLLAFAALMEKSRFYGDYNLNLIIAYFTISILASYFLMRITTTSILKILDDMGRVTKEIASGGRAAFKVLSLEKEFVSIEYALMEMAWEIDEHRKNLEIKVEQRTDELQSALSDLKGRDDQIQKQLDMASVIQRSILPRNIDDWNELKFSVKYIAMEKIGGDFYDVHQLKDDKLGIMIADVSGHGIPAALVTTMAKISFGNAGARFDSPRRIFQEVNQSILDHVKTQDYLTCFMIAIDDEYNVVYSNASHQKAIIIRTDQNKVELLDTNGLFIGAIEDARDSYEEMSTKLNYGDRIVLYTDGIPEAINENRKEYSNKRLESICLQNKSLPLEEFSNQIIEDVEKHIGESNVEDDITLLVIELAKDEAIRFIKDSQNLINSHKYFEAIDMLEEGLKNFPDNQKIIYNLAKDYFRVNNFSKAVLNIERYIENDKRNKYAYYIGGAAHYQMMDYQTAIEYFDRALELDSNFSNALFALGMTYKKMGRVDDAIKTFERVVVIDPDNKMALFEIKELK